MRGLLITNFIVTSGDSGNAGGSKAKEDVALFFKFY